MEYTVHDILLNKHVPKEVEDVISIFREKIINKFQYEVKRVIHYKWFVENKGKFIPIFDIMKSDLDLGIYSIKNKFFKDSFYQNYLLEKDNLFAAEFESVLSFIERRYSRLKDSTGYSTIKAFRKAVSGGLSTQTNFFAFGVGFKFLKQHFSFIHGTFRERNFDLFHSEKKKFIRMETNKEVVGEIKLSNHKNNSLSLTISYDPSLNEDRKEEDLTFRTLKEKLLFVSLYNQFKEYSYKINTNPFIANAIYAMGLSASSRKKISLTYVLIDDKPLELIKSLKKLKLKNKEYLTDTVYRFKNSLELDTAIHPVSLITHHDYIDFKPEDLEVFMLKVLSSYKTNYFNGFSSYIKRTFILNNRTVKLFQFIDRFGLEFTLNLLSKEIKIENKEYQSFEEVLNKNLSINVDYSGKFYITETSKYNQILENAFSSLEKKEFLKDTNFRYYYQALFKNDLKKIVSREHSVFFDSINHLFFFSLLSMIGVDVHQLSFDDAIDTEIKSYLRTENQIFENEVLKDMVSFYSSFSPIERNKHLIALSFIKKLSQFFLSNGHMTETRQIACHISYQRLYEAFDKRSVEELKQLNKSFVRFLRTTPDFENIFSFFIGEGIDIDAEIAF